MRRVLVELMGMPRFAAQARPQVLDRDTDASGMPRRLLRIATPDDEPYTLVEVTCPSTGHRHYLRVPPTVTRCSEAVAWTFGFEVEAYLPMVEA